MDGDLWVQETHVNESKGWQIGETDVYETYTDSRGKLFRDMQSEYGRCVSAMYVDVAGGPPRVIGWVFQKRRPYEDRPRETYVHEVWVSVHSAPPTRTVQYHYVETD